MPRYLLLLALLFFWGNIKGQQGHISPGLSKGFVSGNSFGMNIKLLHLDSRSTSVHKYSVGYPVSRIRANYSGLDLLVNFSGVRMRHFLTTSLALPARLSSAGLHNDLAVIDSERSIFTRQQQMYHFNLPLITYWNSIFWYGATAVMQFDSRAVYNQWGGFEEKWDISAGFGPNLAADFTFSGRFSLRCEAHFPVVFPNTSAARLKSGSGSAVFFEGRYQSLRLLPFLEFQGKANVFKGISALAGYRYTHQVGYANPGLPASVSTTLTEATDGIHELFFGLRYHHHGRWLLRKQSPGCRSTEF